MNKMMLAMVYAGMAAGSAMAADQAFQKTKLPDAKGGQTPVELVFNDGRQAIEVNSAGRLVTAVPYGSIHQLSYDYAKKRRITQGAIVMTVSLGAGAVVMLTKSRKHYLTVAYQDGMAPKELVLRLDKSEYREILAAAHGQTGLEVRIAK